VNMGGTVMVFDAARAAGAIPVVYASSAAVYGDQDAERLGESLMPRPRSAYGADKYGAELQGRAAFLVHGVPNIGFRFFNVYGSRQDPKSPYSGVISIFADRLVAGLPLSVHGDGLQTRDFVFVGDIVRFLLAGMEALGGAPRADVFNACTGNATTILHLSEVLGRLLNQRVRLSFGAARPGDIRVSLGDPARARDLLGMAARTTLWEGLRATLANAGAPDRIAEAV